MSTFTFDDSLTKNLISQGEKILYLCYINTVDFPILHGHRDYWEFTILTNGRLTHFINGKKEQYEQNTLFFASPADRHNLRKNCSGKLRYINIMIREEHLYKLLDAFSPSFRRNFSQMKHSYILPTSLIENIEELIYPVYLLTSKQYSTYNDLLSATIILLLQYLFTQTLSNPFLIDEKKPKWLLELSNLESNPQFLKFSIDDLCTNLNYSRMQLHRLFKKYLNTTPHDYLTQHKLHYAKSLLRNTDMKVLDIAMSIGYSTLAQFNNNFKKRYKMTPSEYRKQSGTVKNN